MLISASVDIFASISVSTRACHDYSARAKAGFDSQAESFFDLSPHVLHTPMWVPQAQSTVFRLFALTWDTIGRDPQIFIVPRFYMWGDLDRPTRPSGS